MALFSSDNNDKKLSQGSQVKSSSLLSSKNADGSASNRVTSTVKTLNPRSSSPLQLALQLEVLVLRQLQLDLQASAPRQP